MIHKTISHFKIISKIDEGGMGEIFLAEDMDLNRQVALKSLPRHLLSNDNLIDRFKREARAAAALKHPNIVTVYELFKHGDKFYIAMEYIDGICLNTIVEQKELSVQKAIFVAVQICRGLRKAHSVGIIHRDIKPANIMVDKDGWVKILDFGLAKLSEYTRITRHGVRMGTARYISPEQIRGEEIDVASDIFSLGVMLYEMIAGHHPFEGETEEEIMYAILRKKPKPLSRYRSGVTPGLQKLVERALHKDPQKRYQRVHDFMLDLKREKRHFARRHSSKSRKVTAEAPVFTIKDIDTKRFRIGWIRFTTALITVRSRLRSLGSRRFLLPAALFFLLTFAVTISLAVFGAREHWQDRDKRGNAPIANLLQVEETSAFWQELNALRRRNLVTVGKSVDYTALDHCYLFIMDNSEVLDVLVVRDDSFHSLKTNASFKTPPNRYTGKTKIWVQDVSGTN